MFKKVSKVLTGLALVAGAVVVGAYFWNKKYEEKDFDANDDSDDFFDDEEENNEQISASTSNI